jgi:hypothetical protein
MLLSHFVALAHAIDVSANISNRLNVYQTLRKRLREIFRLESSNILQART